MSTFFRTHRAYCLVTAALALIATVLRALSVALFTDKASGYFLADAALPIITHVVMALAAIALALYPLLLLKGRVAVKRARLTSGGVIGSLLCALLFFLNFISACISGSTLPGPLLAVTLLALLCATLYFLLAVPRFQVSVKTRTVLGALAVAALACLVALTYFDVATPMNAPHKTELHLALLAAMLYLLYELRDSAEFPMPRMMAACSALAFFLAVTVGFSDLLAYTVGIYESPLYLAEDLLLPALAVYIGARSIADAAHAPIKSEQKGEKSAL